MQLASLPDRRADPDPNGFAIFGGAQSLTNAEFLDRVRVVTRHLKNLGTGPGDVVALKLTNRIDRRHGNDVPAHLALQRSLDEERENLDRYIAESQHSWIEDYRQLLKRVEVLRGFLSESP